MRNARNRIARTVACLLALAVLGCQSGAAEPDDARIENASVTVFPIVLNKRPNQEVTNVVALMLERGGLKRIEFGPSGFAADSTFKQQCLAFAAFAAKQPLNTDYALHGAYLGSAKGATEVRCVLVDAKGKVIWSDRQRPGDKDFDKIKPRNPEQCTKLLLKRLSLVLRLDDPYREDAPRGAIAKRIAQESGLPDKAGRAAMKKRLAKLREAAPKATVLVYPARIDNASGQADTKALVGLINRQKLLSARAAENALPFQFTSSMNQQKVLWSAARSVQKLFRKQQPDADYVLAAHYIMNPRTGKAFAVHLFLLDRKGDFVIVDYQNDHHGDFRRLRPASPSDCSKLALVRLAGYLK